MKTTPNSAILSDTYKDYHLFNSVEDRELRTFNQATVIANILEDNRINDRVSYMGRDDSMGYFNEILPLDKEVVLTKVKSILKERGYDFG